MINCIHCGTIIPEKRQQARRKPKYCSNKCIKDYWKLNNKESDLLAKRKSQLGRRYGITWEEVLDMHDRQQGCCAICREPIPILVEKCRAYLDHNHTTGKVRELLCQHCNSMIGFAKDNTTVLRLAVDYLEKHRQNDEDILVIFSED